MKPPICIMPIDRELFPRSRFIPLRADRVQRFTVGDSVRLVRGGTAPLDFAYVLEVRADPHPKEFAHCSGRSARYIITGREGWVYDWMLEPTPPAPEPKDVAPACWVLLSVTAAVAGFTVWLMFG